MAWPRTSHWATGTDRRLSVRNLARRRALPIINTRHWGHHAAKAAERSPRTPLTYLKTSSAEPKSWAENPSAYTENFDVRRRAHWVNLDEPGHVRFTTFGPPIADSTRRPIFRRIGARNNISIIGQAPYTRGIHATDIAARCLLCASFPDSLRRRRRPALQIFVGTLRQRARSHSAAR
jgi:hypothetical protein